MPNGCLSGMNSNLATPQAGETGGMIFHFRFLAYSVLEFSKFCFVIIVFYCLSNTYVFPDWQQ